MLPVTSPRPHSKRIVRAAVKPVWHAVAVRQIIAGKDVGRSGRD